MCLLEINCGRAAQRIARALSGGGANRSVTVIVSSAYELNVFRAIGLTEVYEFLWNDVMVERMKSDYMTLTDFLKSTRCWKETVELMIASPLTDLWYQSNSSNDVPKAYKP